MTDYILITSIDNFIYSQWEIIAIIIDRLLFIAIFIAHLDYILLFIITLKYIEIIYNIIVPTPDLL